MTEATRQDQRIQTICLLILSAVAIGASLFWLRAVMIPFVLALFFSVGLAPIVDVQMRYLHLPRPAAVMATLFLVFLALNLVTALASLSLGQLSAKIPLYQEQIQQMTKLAAGLLKKLGLRQWSDVDPLSLMSATNVGSMLLGTTNAVVGLLSDSVLVMIFLAFLLLGEPMASVGFWGEVQSQIKVYLVAKVVLSTATGFLVGIILWSLGVDLALVFGLFTFLLNFIPNVGPIIATLLPLPVVLVSPDVSATSAVLAILLPLVIHQIFGNIVEPRMMGTSLDLDPVAILLALIFWGTLWGVVGMLLATPITGVLRILLQRLDITAPLGDVLAGRR